MATYRVRIRKNEVEVEVESSEKEYVESKLKELDELLRPKPISGKAMTIDAAPTAAPGKGRSLAEHARALAPKSGTQYVIAVGDYLERFGGLSRGFKTRDVADAFRAVKYKHSNPAEAVRQAKQQGFLMDGEEPGSLVLTQTAESWVKGQLATETGE